MSNELDKYNKEGSCYNMIKTAIETGWIEFGHNEWANKEEIRKLCSCKRLTKLGFEPIEKERKNATYF